MTNETTVPGARAPNQYEIANVESALQGMIEICAEYYHGCDMAEDAIEIAKLVLCTGEEDEDTAERILNSMGYLTNLMEGWENLKPETCARLHQITTLALPGYHEDVVDLELLV
jgi:hypothetical protein